MYTVLLSDQNALLETAINISIRKSNHINGFVERAKTVAEGKKLDPYRCIYIRTDTSTR